MDGSFNLKVFRMYFFVVFRGLANKSGLYVLYVAHECTKLDTKSLAHGLRQASYWSKSANNSEKS